MERNLGGSVVADDDEWILCTYFRLVLLLQQSVSGFCVWASPGAVFVEERGPIRVFGGTLIDRFRECLWTQVGGCDKRRVRIE